MPFFILGFELHYFLLSDFHKKENFQHCKPALIALGCFYVILHMNAESILYIRAYALWGRKRILMATFSMIVSACFVAASYITWKQDDATTVIMMPLIRNGCIINFSGSKLWLAYLVLIASETLAITFLVLGAFHYKQSTLVKTIVKDGKNPYHILFLHHCHLSGKCGSFEVRTSFV